MTRFQISLLVAAISAAAAIAAGPAIGTTATTTFHVGVTVPSSCSLTATDLNFPDVPANPATPIDATSTISVTCTLTTAYAVSLDAGTATGATVTSRKMSNGANTISYALYSTAPRTTIWGDGTLSTVTVSGTGNGAAQVLTVYGRIPSGQTNLAAGHVQDTITATVTY